MKTAVWSRFNIAAISLMALVASSSPALALERDRPDLTPKVSNDQINTCDDSEIETLIIRWRESYLPSGAALRNCGDSAVDALTAVLNDSTVRLRTRYLTARLMGQVGSELAIHHLFAALGNDLPQESDRTQLQSIGLKGIETILEKEPFQYGEDGFSNTTLPGILRSQDLPPDIRLGAMQFTKLYAATQASSWASKVLMEANRALTTIVADEQEVPTMRLNAIKTLSELIYHTDGDFAVEASNLEKLVKVAESDGSPAIRQGAVNALMMTYYMTFTDADCEWRWQETNLAEEAVNNLANSPNIDSLWDLGDTKLSRLQSQRVGKIASLKGRIALNNLIDLPHPAGQDLCEPLLDEGALSPGAFFIRHIESKNQPRLYALLVAWARSL